MVWGVFSRVATLTSSRRSAFKVRRRPFFGTLPLGFTLAGFGILPGLACRHDANLPESAARVAWVPSAMSTAHRPLCPAEPPADNHSRCSPVPGSYISRRPTSNHCRANSWKPAHEISSNSIGINGSVLVFFAWWAIINRDAVFRHTCDTPRRTGPMLKMLDGSTSGMHIYAGSTAITSNSSPLMNRPRASWWAMLPNWGKSSEEDKPANIGQVDSRPPLQFAGLSLGWWQARFPPVIMPTRARSVDLQPPQEATPHCKAYPQVDE